MSGLIGYEIFLTSEAFDAKNTAIETLLGIPSSDTDTYQVKDLQKNLAGYEWFGCVVQELVDATASLTYEDCLQYYDRDNLVAPGYINDPVNGWVLDF